MARRDAKPRATDGRLETGVVAKRPGRYHHGDLRRALLDATLDLIERRGPEGFTLRAAARAAGVSDAAPYHHFTDKNALLAAIAQEGFELLTARLRPLAAAAESADGALEAARAMGVEYVVFAAAHPSHFRVMAGRSVLRNTEYPELARASVEAFSLVQQALLAGVAAQRERLPVDALIFGSWALVHGFAYLAVDGHLGAIARDEARLRALVRSAVTLYELYEHDGDRPAVADRRLPGPP